MNAVSMEHYITKFTIVAFHPLAVAERILQSEIVVEMEILFR